MVSKIEFEVFFSSSSLTRISHLSIAKKFDSTGDLFCVRRNGAIKDRARMCHALRKAGWAYA